LSFKRENGRLLAHAGQELAIKNPGLGYEITANLKLFDWSLKKEGGVFLFNYIRFSDVGLSNQAENKIITLKRYDTYTKSIRRFFKLLNEKKNIREYDYNITRSDIHLLEIRNEILYEELVNLNITIPNKQNYRNVYLYEISYQFGRFLKVSFNGNESTIKTKDRQPILVDANGNIINTADVVISGYWAKQRTADMLPFDYEPPEKITF